MSYATEHASAYADIAAAGASVQFAQQRQDAYDPTTGAMTRHTAVVPGAAIRVKGDPMRYSTLNLSESESPTLLFAPSVLGELPPLGAEVVWNGALYRVVDISPVAPDGAAIVARIIVTGGGVTTVAAALLDGRIAL